MTDLARLICALTVLCISSGCTLLRGSETDQALAYMAAVDSMNKRELAQLHTTTLQAYTTTPSQLHALRLGYVLSRPLLPQQDIEASRILIKGLDASIYPVRKLLLSELDLLTQLQGLQTQNDQLQTELDTVRQQLDALRTIERDLSQDRQATDLLSP